MHILLLFMIGCKSDYNYFPHEQGLHWNYKIIFKKFQMGDVYKTHASVAKLDKTINYRPKFTIMRGIDEFVDWYKRYFKK